MFLCCKGSEWKHAANLSARLHFIASGIDVHTLANGASFTPHIVRTSLQVNASVRVYTWTDVYALYTIQGHPDIQILTASLPGGIQRAKLSRN